MKRLALDPGEMFGWSLWIDGEKIDGGQMPGREFVDLLEQGLDVHVGDHHPERYEPFEDIDVIIMEDWVTYPWEAHAGNLDWDSMETPRLIGMIELLALMAGIPIVFQGADIGKRRDLAEDEYVQPVHPNRHENDSVSHGAWDWIQRRLGKR